MNVKKGLKTLYRLVPFKKTLFSILKKIWVPPFHRHLHFKGLINVRVSEHESFKIHHHGYELENEIFWKGITGWEKMSTNVWIQLCRNSNSVMDIGANTGVYSLIAKAVNPLAKVYAFEPVTRVFKKLALNSEVNGYDIVCSEYAVSNFNGEAIIYDTDDEHIYSVTVNKNRALTHAQAIQKKIRTITLKEFIEQNKIQHIDLMKIDVETHEPEVLEGFDRYLQLFRPTILIEVLDDEVGAKVESIVRDKGYLYFNIDERSGIRKVDTITQSAFFNYLLCNESVASSLRLI